MNQVSDPIAFNNGEYLLVQITSRTPSSFDKVKADVQAAVEQAGVAGTTTAIDRAEKRADVSVDPRYGVWVPSAAQILTPFTPAAPDVPNASANSVGLATSAAKPFGG